jgi:hypothetical protein
MATLLFAIGMARFVVARNRFDAVWAEDGLFLRAAIVHGLGSIGRTYAGYLHVGPRLIAVVVAPMPARYVPLALIIASVAVTALVAVFVTSVSRDILPVRWTRLLLGFAVVAIPVSGAEAFGNIANLQQFLWFGGLWACIGSIDARWERVSAVLLVCATALSSPLCFLLFPFVVRRVRTERVMVISYFVSLAVQLIAVATVDGGRAQLTEGSKSPVRQMTTFGTWVANGVTSHHQGGLSILGLAFVASAAAVFWSTRRVTRLLIGLVAITGAYWFVSTGFGMGPAYRHAMVPALLAVMIVLIVGHGSRLLPWIGAGLALLWVISLGIWGIRDDGPSWIDAVHDAAGCVGTTRLPLAPNDWGDVEYPCDRL